MKTTIKKDEHKDSEEIYLDYSKYFGIGKDLGLDEEPKELDFEDDDIDLEVLKK